jgi:hypothetical protein
LSLLELSTLTLVIGVLAVVFHPVWLIATGKVLLTARRSP